MGNVSLYGQVMEIIPAKGRRRQVNLNRKVFTIKFGKYEKVILLDQTIFVPSFSEEKSFIINWTGEEFEISVEREGYISINKTKLKKGVINVGDRINEGFSIINFRKKTNVGACPVDNDFELMNQADLPILLEGETGTGKTRLAKKFHEQSDRSSFVHLNISAFSPTLLESELFGHVKGAFTGAINDKVGAFERADKGTLFIDEIDSLPIELQVKLLTFLDSGEFIPVGGERTRKVSCKLIIASGRSLKYLVKSGAFRSDLFFRLESGFSLELKPLRHSQKLVSSFIKFFEEEHSCTFDKRLIKFYCEYQWPGNYRQLKGHLLKKKALSSTALISFGNEESNLLEVRELITLPFQEGHSLENIKSSYIRYIYYKCGKDLEKTANVLEITTKTIMKFLSAN